jgi:hypothetical protein
MTPWSLSLTPLRDAAPESLSEMTPYEHADRIVSADPAAKEQPGHFLHLRELTSAIVQSLPTVVF